MTLLSLHHHHHHHHRRHLSLTARVVGAPQMISLPVSFIFPVLHCPLGLGELQACPFPDVVFNDDLLRLWLKSVQYDLQNDFAWVTDEADRW